MKFQELQNICSVRSGGTPSKRDNNLWGDHLPWITAKDLKVPVLRSSLLMLSELGEAKAKITPADSLLILVRGMTLFKDVPVCLAGRELAFNQDIKALVLDDGIDPKYVLYYLVGSKHKLMRLVDSAGHGTGRLNTDLLKAFPILLPPLPEQKAIAAVLSTWDAAIEKTERLIEAKERRFRGLMQELIPGAHNNSNRRESRKVKVGEVCEVITSNVDKKVHEGEMPVRLCNYMDVYRNYYITQKLGFMSASASSSEIEKYQLRVHDVILTKDSETADDIANSACVLEAPQDLVCGYHLAILRPNEELFGPYLNFALHTPRIRYEFSRQANGVTRFGLTMSAYNMVELPLPSWDEQQAIAEALTRSQEEITLLKLITEKYKAQKRGLMQKLLTGEWRVNLG
ncbi:restriction endonuclease subunit S [Coraliomargarita algicola]|uniref:Restriction endonuclease subunit S n=1 Tax=Coraliomargarita algicola TaxID=3092156 RepID=A0ABZ0RQT2_9BACT|nr:restriction endonuclease subunit S [Coraliomargarita sp. J2-16]WPJ97771.1 restriction endonuclease subunit S [Coraliomargarita sp. J2-16]